MKVIISGLTASGKSTLAKGLSDELRVEYFSASSKLRELMPPKDFEYWETKKGLDAVKFRLKNPRYDRKLDDYIVNYVKSHDNIILDSWVASWKVNDKNAIKIYLKADIETRAQRVSQRDGVKLSDALRFMKEKDKLTSKIYLNLYKIKIDSDLTPFDLVVNTSRTSAEALKNLCFNYIINSRKPK